MQDIDLSKTWVYMKILENDSIRQALVTMARVIWKGYVFEFIYV